MSGLGLPLNFYHTVSACLNNAIFFYFNANFAHIFYIGFGSDDKVILFIFFLPVLN